MQEIAQKLAKELGISAETIINTYKAYWQFIREKIKNLPLKKNLSEEEFNYLKTSFNLPSMGKLYCDYSSWERQRSKIIKSENENSNEYYED